VPQPAAERTAAPVKGRFMEILYKARGLRLYGHQQGNPPAVGSGEGGRPFRTMMKAVHETFGICCGEIGAAASRLAILSAELRLIGP
jgi:hypothetical protein